MDTWSVKTMENGQIKTKETIKLRYNSIVKIDEGGNLKLKVKDLKICPPGKDNLKI